jgi:putative membrane protein
MQKQILTQKELQTLAGVIGELEEKTIGEIRLMIVKRSSVTGHVHTTLWALMLAITFLIIWFERHDLIYFERWWMWPSLVVGLYFVAAFFSRFAAVQRAFTSDHDLHHQVMARAEVEFNREGLSGTSAHTGVLIFLSLMEKIAVVLADKGIAEKVPVHGWDKVIAKVIAGAKSGRWAEKLEDALRECGAYLANHFPATGSKKDELSNAVILKD